MRNVEVTKHVLFLDIHTTFKSIQLFLDESESKNQSDVFDRLVQRKISPSKSEDIFSSLVQQKLKSNVNDSIIIDENNDTKSEFVTSLSESLAENIGSSRSDPGELLNTPVITFIEQSQKKCKLQFGKTLCDQIT